MKIKLNSVLVNNQEKALRFYTEILGFVKKRDIPMGEHRWLTVVSPEEQDGPELVLEPMAFPPAADYQQALFGANIPATAFQVSNARQEYERLQALGVVFCMAPTVFGVSKLAVFNDTCGNFIQFFEVI